jgi:NAD-dependent DNA ligase
MANGLMPKGKHLNKQQRFIDLGWLILEHKWRYYIGVRYGVSPVSDAEYDKLEDEYVQLADELIENAYSSTMVGFDINRPSCQLVDSKMKTQYKVKE